MCGDKGGYTTQSKRQRGLLLQYLCLQNFIAISSSSYLWKLCHKKQHFWSRQPAAGNTIQYGRWGSGVFSPGHIPPRTYPLGHFPLPDNSSSLLHSVGYFPLPTMYNIKWSTINVYKIHSGRSVRVRSMGWCQFSHFRFNPLTGTLKSQSNGPLYSNKVIGTLAVDGWAVTFGTARRGLGGLGPRPVPSSLYQM